MSTKKALVTEIKKKYKDKKTGEWKETTIHYSKVKDRLKEFWEANPHGKTQTEHKNIDGEIEFKAWLWKDKSELLDLMKAGVIDSNLLRNSADANGTAKDKAGDEKNLEKLETIAVGRALALLGYAADGEIASSEEMEAFMEHQKEQLAEQVMEITEAIGNCATQEELKTYWSALSGEMKLLAEGAKDAKKKELEAVKDVQ